MNVPEERPFIFLSYAHVDKAFVMRLAADLEANDISIWIDQQGIPPGSPDWEQNIRAAVSAASAVILIASPQARSSPVVRDELAVAKMYQRPVYPLWASGTHWIDAIPLGWGYTQYIDARDTAYEAAISQLVTSLKRVLAVSSITREEAVIPGLAPSQKEDVTHLQSSEHLQLANITQHTLQDWGDAPDVSTFFGRTEELSTLEQWIVNERCRLIAIVGIRGIGKTSISVKLGKGGIGKTDLSLKLAQGLQEHFKYIIWRKLINAPKLVDIIADLIKVLSNQQDIDLPDAVDEQVSKLLFYLREHRCLLILDNAETLLQGGQYAGQYREGYENYGQLFRAIAEVPHQSCLLLTSREKPKEIAQLEGKTRPVRSLPLSGLDYTDCQKIFEAFGTFSGSEEEWRELNDFYNGNPLALELAARHIEEVFYGSISDFLREGKQVFTDLHDLLNWHFDRLPEAAKEIAFWLAINREPMSLTELKADIMSPIDKEKVSSTLQLLQRLLPLERTASTFTLQPVLIEYINISLVEQFIKEVKEGQFLFFNKYALLKSVAKDYVRDSQIRLHLEPVLQNLLATFGKSNSEKKLKQLLHSLQEEPPYQAGYAAGNILNLLIHLKADLRNADFSHLPIWQAYLREAHLIDVNFAHADFVKPAFIDTFGNILSVAFSPDKKLLAAGTSNGEIRIWQAADGMPVLNSSGHTDWVWAIAFSPDGNLLASGSSDQTIRLWNVTNGHCLQILQGHRHRIRSVAFHPDGSRLASASEDYTVKLWNVHTGALLNTLTGHTNPARSIAFSFDGKTLVSGSDDRTIRVWETTTGTCTHILRGHTSQVWSIAFSPNGRTIASGSDDQTVRVWDLVTETCLHILQGHTSWICSLAFNPDGTLLASGSADQNVRIWDPNTGQPIKTLQGHTNWVNSVSFSPDGTTLASGSHDQTIRQWEVNTGFCLATLRGYSTSTRVIAFSPNEKLLASGDREVHLWNIDAGQKITTLSGNSAGIRSLAFSPDGTLIASGSDDQTIHVWKIQDAQLLYTLSGHTNRVKSIAFNYDGTLLVSGSDDQTVRLWKMETGQQLRTLYGHTNRIRAVAFSPQNSLFASGSDDQTARLWNTQTDQTLYTLEGHTNRVWSIAFSPDGQQFATGSEDSTIRLWDTSTGHCINVLTGHTNPVWSIAFHPQGSLLASSSEDKTVRLWQVKTSECTHILQKHTNPIWAIAFSPDGTILASGSHDHTICLWDTSTGKNLGILQGHDAPIWVLNFSLDGTLLASGSDDGTCRVWEVKSGTCKWVLKSEMPYERMNIFSVTGLTEAQKSTLRALGAIEKKQYK